MTESLPFRKELRTDCKTKVSKMSYKINELPEVLNDSKKRYKLDGSKNTAKQQQIKFFNKTRNECKASQFKNCYEIVPNLLTSQNPVKQLKNVSFQNITKKETKPGDLENRPKLHQVCAFHKTWQNKTQIQV